MNTDHYKKVDMFRRGQYTIPVPPVSTAFWRESDWVAFIDREGIWEPESEKKDAKLWTYVNGEWAELHEVNQSLQSVKVELPEKQCVKDYLGCPNNREIFIGKLKP